MKRRNRTLLGLLVVAFLLVLGLGGLATRERTIASAASRPSVHPALTKVTRNEKIEDSPVKPQTLHSRLGGSISLQQGESCVLSYHTDFPDKCAMIEVTPELSDDGLIRTSVRVIESPYLKANSGTRSQVMPDLFDVQRQSAVSREDMARLRAELATDEATKMVSYPTMASRPECPVSIRSLVNGPDGNPLAGMSLSLNMKLTSSGFDLDTGLDVYSQRPTHHEDED